MLSRQRKKYVISEIVLLNFIPFFGVVFLGWDMTSLYMAYAAELCMMSFVIYFRILFQGIVFRELANTFIAFVINSVMFGLSFFAVTVFLATPELNVDVKFSIYVLGGFLIVYSIEMFKEIFELDNIYALFFTKMSFSEGVRRRRKKIMSSQTSYANIFELIVIEPFIYLTLIIFAGGATIFIPVWNLFIDVNDINAGQYMAKGLLFYMILFRTLFILFKSKTRFKAL